MREVIRRGARDALGLSVLFPATTGLYRGLGWEHAGTFTQWRVDARVVPAGGPSMRPLDDEWEAVERCQAQWAASLHGPEARTERRWEGLREATRFAYGLDATDGHGFEAYVLLEHKHAPDDWQHTLELVDWAALSPRGLQAVVGFVGRHGTLARDALFRAPTPNPWGLLLPEQDLTRADDFDWMARPLDLAAAIGARGFPEAVSAAVTVAVDDPVLEAGPRRLVVADGRGALEPASHADVRMDVTAVGPLVTGYRSASELARAGRLAGPEPSLRQLDAAFAGPLPTLLDFF
jgi:predicted acetyltransferase